MAGKNQGEGDRDSARRYNEKTREFVESGKVDQAARESSEDIDAERQGRERAKELDPEVHRDYSKPQK
jgi:hypothetical protein